MLFIVHGCYKVNQLNCCIKFIFRKLFCKKFMDIVEDFVILRFFRLSNKARYIWRMFIVSCSVCLKLCRSTNSYFPTSLISYYKFLYTYQKVKLTTLTYNLLIMIVKPLQTGWDRTRRRVTLVTQRLISFLTVCHSANMFSKF